MATCSSFATHASQLHRELLAWHRAFLHFSDKLAALRGTKVLWRSQTCAPFSLGRDRLAHSSRLHYRAFYVTAAMSKPKVKVDVYSDTVW